MQSLTTYHTQNILELKNICFTYNSEKVLENINLTIHKGDYLGVVGPNGGGKTTLLKLMLGLLRPTSGTIKMAANLRASYVPQKVVRFENSFPATVGEVVSMGRFGHLGLLKFPGELDKKKVKESLEAVGMWQYKNQLIGDLSGGQQQRVFIARALVSEPEIIFLDEPTVGVDIKTQEQFYSLLEDLNSKMGITLVLVSHDIDVIASQTSELACINKTLVYHGLPRGFVKGDFLKLLYGKGVKQILHDH